MKLGTSTTLRLGCIGALAFWGPDTVIHGIRRYSFDSRDVWTVTAVMPLTLLLSLLVCSKLSHLRAGTIAIRMLAGIWLLGGVFMMVSATFGGGGFAGSDGMLRGLMVIGISLLPIFTCVCAAYDGSLGALLIVSLVLFVVWIVEPTTFRSRSAKAAQQE